MSELILHHYAASPFSEKIRLMMGYKTAVYPDLQYKAVDIPVIMPKPTLMPLTGPMCQAICRLFLIPQKY